MGALASIGHRVSGMLLVVFVPFGVCLLDRSLRDEQGFAEGMGLLGYAAVRVAVALARCGGLAVRLRFAGPAAWWVQPAIFEMFSRILSIA